MAAACIYDIFSHDVTMNDIIVVGSSSLSPYLDVRKVVKMGWQEMFPNTKHGIMVLMFNEIFEKIVCIWK